MNAIEKLHALLISDKVNVWHYPLKKEGPKFFYWKTGQPPSDGEFGGYGFDTLEQMIDAAYANIDPLLMNLPDFVVKPELAVTNEGDAIIKEAANA